MFKSLSIFLILAAISIVISTNALAWGDLGHSIVGGVAEANLSPQAKDFVRGVLGIEPLSTAAVWPDHVRDDVRFGHHSGDSENDDHDFAPYHFAEIPTGETYDSKAKVKKDAYGLIMGATAVLEDADSKFSREEKMIALRYLVHVVGDIHQPLHVGNGFDQGGNVCQVYWMGSKNPSNFHSIWDDNMVIYLGDTYRDKTPSQRSARYLGDYLSDMKITSPQMFGVSAKAKYSDVNVKAWLQEAATLREEKGFYPDKEGALDNVSPDFYYKHRAYCLWFSDQDKGILGDSSLRSTKDIKKEDIPTLDETYAYKYASLVESQLLKGGVRLAVLIDHIASVAKNVPAPLDDTTEDSDILQVQKAFKN